MVEWTLFLLSNNIEKSSADTMETNKGNKESVPSPPFSSFKEAFLQMDELTSDLEQRTSAEGKDHPNEVPYANI